MNNQRKRGRERVREGGREKRMKQKECTTRSPIQMRGWIPGWISYTSYFFGWCHCAIVLDR